MWEFDHKEGWAPKNWCFWTVVLEKTLESPLDCKETQPVNPKGNQSWIIIWRTDVEAEAPILWPPDAKTWLIGKDSDAGKDWRQEEKGTIKDEMVERHHWLSGHEFEQVWEMVRTGKPGTLQSMELQRVAHDWVDHTTRQEYSNGWPFPSPVDLPKAGIKPASPAWQVHSLPLSHLGSSSYITYCSVNYRASLVALVVKNLPANTGDVKDPGSVPGLGQGCGGRHGNLLQYSCLENLIDRGVWWATIHRVAKSWSYLKWLSMHACSVNLLCCTLHLSSIYLSDNGKFVPFDNIHTISPSPSLPLVTKNIICFSMSFLVYLLVWASQVVQLVKNLLANAGDGRDTSLIPGSGRSPGGGNSNPLQYSCLYNSMDRGPQRAIVHGVEESDTDEHSIALLACLFLKCNCPTTLC